MGGRADERRKENRQRRKGREQLGYTVQVDTIW